MAMERVSQTTRRFRVEGEDWRNNKHGRSGNDTIEIWMERCQAVRAAREKELELKKRRKKKNRLKSVRNPTSAQKQTPTRPGEG